MLKEIFSNRILLSYTTDEHLPIVIDMEKKNSKFVFSWTEEQHKKEIADPDKLHLVIKSKLNDRLLGYIIIGGLKSKDKSMELKRIVVNEKGCGYGKESIGLIKKFCFDVKGFHRLWLDVFDDNKAAIRLYLKEGFVKEGLMRECKKNGEAYRSMFLMSILEHEYNKAATIK
ncbi:GNAT family protein [Proteinivorax tanatarense]|uniref:GNAT family protein n=1 Tax=Proteinivorax tanatarense TaxID=1260629 RepID=A0AAU7VNB2_9FIRM